MCIWETIQFLGRRRKTSRRRGRRKLNHESTKYYNNIAKQLAKQALHNHLYALAYLTYKYKYI
jgi:hypothetical protein